MHRVYKYRLYPTKAQAEAMQEALNFYRTLYNAGLQERRDAWRHSRLSLNSFTQSLQLKEIERPAPASFKVCQQVLRRLDKSFANFFRRVKAGEKPGFPRFKGRDGYDSFEWPVHGDVSDLRESRRLTVPCIGKVKVKVHNGFEGHYKSAVAKRVSGKWYAHLRVEVADTEPLPATGRQVGIDVGLYHYAALSTGETVENPRHLRSALKGLRRKQRKLSRCKRGSNTRRKVKVQVAKLHQRVASQRRDHAHKLSKRLVAENDAIYLEDLQICNMVRNNKLSLSITDASWGMFRQFLTYKAESAGREVVAVNPRGTSQACPSCGTVQPKPLSQRWHRCDCGLSCDRDVASALEILRRGQRLAGITRPVAACVPAEVDLGLVSSL